jgi:hypothetical protein
MCVVLIVDVWRLQQDISAGSQQSGLTFSEKGFE